MNLRDESPGRTVGFRRRCQLGALLSALLLAGSIGCERSAPSDDRVAAPVGIDGKGRNVLLVSVDTLRADSLGCYGHAGVSTPNIDRLAAGGVRFTQCISSVPITLPSHSTMMTGSYQYVHGARDNGLFKLGSENVTLAERFKEAGYATHAVLAAMVLNRRYGMDQGFDTYDDLEDREGDSIKGGAGRDPAVAKGDPDAPPDQRPAPGEPTAAPLWASFDREADEITQIGIKLLERNRDNPFFIFVHYFDPHQPPKAPQRFSAQYQDGYLAEIAYVDEQFGLLMEALGELGLAERTLVILTSDHGEGRGEHGEQTHSYFIYDSTLHVPLIVSVPGQVPGGGVVESQVRLVDLAPTILEFAGLEPTPQMQGTSLLPLLGDPSRAVDLPAYADTVATQVSFGYSQLRALRHGGWKYILSPEPELYHLAEDPLELFNLARLEPQRAASMREELRSLVAESPAPPGSRLARQEVDEEELRRLRALGYLAGGAEQAPLDAEPSKNELDDFEPTGRNPVHHKEAIELMNMSLGLLLSGKYAEAEANYRRLLELEPGNAKAYKEIADAVAAQKRYEEAEELYREALKLDPVDELTRRSLAKVLVARGDLPGAEKECRAAVGLNPADHVPHVQLGNVLLRRGRYEEAYEEYQAAAALAPDEPEIPIQWALGYQWAGRMPEAEAKLRQALDIDPEYSATRLFLARLFAVTGRPAEAQQQLLAVVEAEPGNVAALEALASSCAKAGELARAQEYYQRAADADPQSAQSHLNRGLGLAVSGKLDEAAEQYRKAIELESDSLRAHIKLAGVLDRAGRTDEAVQACEGALEAMPQQPAAYPFVADFLDRHGKAARAIDVLRNGHSLLPQSVDIANDLAWRLATSGDATLRNGQDAVQLAERARELTDGKNVNVLDTLAAAYAEAGRFEDAATTAKQALQVAEEGGNPALAKRIGQRLSLYERQQPYRDMPMPLATDE